MGNTIAPMKIDKAPTSTHLKLKENRNQFDEGYLDSLRIHISFYLA